MSLVLTFIVIFLGSFAGTVLGDRSRERRVRQIAREEADAVTGGARRRAYGFLTPADITRVEADPARPQVEGDG